MFRALMFILQFGIIYGGILLLSIPFEIAIDVATVLGISACGSILGQLLMDLNETKKFFGKAAKWFWSKRGYLAISLGIFWWVAINEPNTFINIFSTWSTAVFVLVGGAGNILYAILTTELYWTVVARFASNKEKIDEKLTTRESEFEVPERLMDKQPTIAEIEKRWKDEKLVDTQRRRLW